MNGWPLLVSFEAAARALGTDVAGVNRLVAAGLLAPVKLLEGAEPGLRPESLLRLIEDLEEAQMRPRSVDRVDPLIATEVR